MNETLKTIASRYTCRDYKKGESVPDEILVKIAEAGLQAPSARDCQAWRIVVVKDKDIIDDMENTAMDFIKSRGDMSYYKRIMDRGGNIFYNAPCMIVVPIDPSHDYAHIDCGIVCQNIALSAESLGIGNTICGMARLAFEPDSKKFEKKLGFPEGYTFGCAVLLGYANERKDPHPMDKNKVIIV